MLQKTRIVCLFCNQIPNILSYEWINIKNNKGQMNMANYLILCLISYSRCTPWNQRKLDLPATSTLWIFFYSLWPSYGTNFQPWFKNKRWSDWIYSQQICSSAMDSCTVRKRFYCKTVLYSCWAFEERQVRASLLILIFLCILILPTVRSLHS